MQLANGHGSAESIKEGEIIDLTMDSDAEEGGPMLSNISGLKQSCPAKYIKP